MTGLALHEVVPPDVAAVDPGHLLTGPAHDQHLPDVRAPLHRLVDRGLERAGRAPAVPAVGGDDEVRVAVEDASAQGVGREAAEDDRMRCTEAGAGQHGDHRLGDHRHVDGDLVARPHAQLGQAVGGLADHPQEVGVGDGPGVARLALPMEGHPLAQAGGNVAVDAVDGHVEPAADEPLGEGEVPLEHVRPRRVPGELLRLGGPEGQGVRRGLGIDSRLRAGRLGRCLLGAGEALVPWSRADRPSSRISLISWPPLTRRAEPTLLSSSGRSSAVHDAVPSRSSKPSSMKAGVTVAPTRSVAPERPRRLPCAPAATTTCGDVTGRHVPPDHLYVAAPVGPLAAELERVSVG